MKEKIFVSHRNNNQFLFDDSIFISDLEDGQDVCLPLQMDTEFFTIPLKERLKNKELINISEDIQISVPLTAQSSRIPITTQISDYHRYLDRIFYHPDFERLHHQLKTIELPIAKSGFHPVDWLKSVGFDCELINSGRIFDKLPKFTFQIYAHFALAELCMICDGAYLEDIKKLAKSKKGRKFEMSKRLRAVTENKFSGFDYVDVPWCLKIQDILYQCRIVIVDTCALHGNKSYKKLLEATGLETDDKTLMDKYKSNMILGLLRHPSEFCRYALGDLKLVEILEKNAKNMEIVRNKLSVKNRSPKLTVGSTVNDVLCDKLLSILKSEDNKDIKRFCEKSNAGTLKYQYQFTRALLSKVDGGRCRNNRPNLVSMNGVIVDIDYASCYGEGQRNQDYPLGNPVIVDYPIANNNEYISLGKWLKKRKFGTNKSELADGLFYCRVSTFEELKFPQDLIASWFDFKISNLKNVKSEIDPKSGKVKNFTNEIVNGVITSDILDWIFNICSARQRNELLEKLMVVSAIYYNAQCEYTDIDKFLEDFKKFEGKNQTIDETDKSGNIIVVSKVDEFNGWFRLNLGDLIVNELLSNRLQYPKKSPLNELFKLLINTLYGVSVSPFFASSNVVVGNNITARARLACWAAEKGFNGVQSITDGVAFDLNKVVYPVKTKINGENIVKLHRENDVTKKNFRLKPLGDFDGYKLVDKKLYGLKNDCWCEIKNQNEYVNKEAMNHLRELFPLKIFRKESTKLIVENREKKFIPRIGLMSFEMKNFYSQAYFHGSANYNFEGEFSNDLKMRSYENREHFQACFDGDNLVIEQFEENTPANLFFENLKQDSTHLKRSKTFIKSGILKINEYKNNPEKWEQMNKKPGDNINKVGLLREFSISQFMFKNIAQYKSIMKEVESNKRKYNQSYEGYFVNNDGSINYQEMVNEIDRLLCDGVMSLNKIFDKNRHRNRDLNMTHPENDNVKKVTRFLLCMDIDVNDTTDWFDESNDENDDENDGEIFEGDIEIDFDF